VDDNYKFSYVAGTFTVTKEQTVITYTGDTLVSASKVGGSATGNLAATIQEELDGSLGTKLGNQKILFTVTPTSGGGVKTCGPVSVTNIVNGKGVATCSISLTADNYEIEISLVTNDYYKADVESVVVTVTDPGTGFTTGGGWIMEPNLGKHANFGFTVKFLKNGNIQGNSLYIFRATADIGNGLGVREYNFIVKSNAMTGLKIYLLSNKLLACPIGAKSGCGATFTGKATIKAVDRATGVTYNTGGNYLFQVDVSDLAEPGSTPGVGPDTYAIRAWDSTGTYYQLGTPAAQIKINGGNIQVKP
jgi:hypothetical protein